MPGEYADYRATVRVLLEDVTPEVAAEFFRLGQEVHVLIDGVSYDAFVEEVVECPTKNATSG